MVSRKKAEGAIVELLEQVRYTRSCYRSQGAPVWRRHIFYPSVNREELQGEDRFLMLAHDKG